MRFAIAKDWIVTANEDGTIPLSSKVVCRVEEGNAALLEILLAQANRCETLERDILLENRARIARKAPANEED